jgi:hypothetical protein
LAIVRSEKRDIVVIDGAVVVRVALVPKRLGGAGLVEAALNVVYHPQ